MKTLTESLFDDNLVEKDLFEDCLEHLDSKKYSPDAVVDAQANLYDFLKNSGSKRYGFFAHDAKRKEFFKALEGGDYVMMTFNEPCSYSIGWIRPGRPYIFDEYYIGWQGKWICNDLDFDWDLNRETGILDLITRLSRKCDECILIKDKKQMEAIKKCIIKLAR